MNDLSFQISPTFTRKQARLAELGQILRERSLTWDERQECKALEADLRPARLARMFAEMPQMQPQPHDVHRQRLVRNRGCVRNLRQRSARVSAVSEHGESQARM